MRILVYHGYLLRGTGSNQYVQSLARALCRRGHNLVVMCQDPDPRLDFVSVFMREGTGRVSPEIVWERETSYPGSCMVYNPDIGGLLPVYVLDTYEGFEVKEFTGLDEGELDRYVELNRASAARMVEQFVPDAIQVNHAVMLPCIIRPVAEEAGVPYFVTIHGSAIEFTVRKDPRFLPYGAEGLDGASRIIVPSEHSEAVVREVFGPLVERLGDKTVVLPHGVDTELFDMTGRSLVESVRLLLGEVEKRSEGVTVGDFLGRRIEKDAARDESEPGDDEQIEREALRIESLHPEWLAEPDLAERLTALAEADRPFLVFLGKLLETKGIQCVLPALPLIMGDHPRSCLVVVGFGELRGILELMVEALDAGDVRRLKNLCDYGNRKYGERMGGAFSPVLAFFDELAGEGTLDEYLHLCSELDMAGSVIFTGYLTPAEHRYLLPHARAVLAPSLAPEAFGLVVTEAMASGVVPIASNHSGLETALEPLGEVWGAEAGTLTLGTREKLVFRIAAAARMVLDMPEYVLRAKGAEMREAVKESFSWDTVSGLMVEMFTEAARSGP